MNMKYEFKSWKMKLKIFKIN